MNKNIRFKTNLEGVVMPSIFSLVLITGYFVYKPSLFFQHTVFLLLSLFIVWGTIEVFVMQGGGSLRLDLIDSFLQLGGITGLILSIKLVDLNNTFIIYFEIAGFFLIIFGIILRYLAMKTLGIYFSYTLKAEKGKQPLVDYGVYKHIRHPGYLAIFLITLSFSLIHASFIGFITTAIFSWLFINKRISYEEKLMIESMDGTYTAYMRKTKKLIPLIY
ncbi:MAG: isoprenylcysteine carboxylmethyltransferase family protein [bacterium]